MVGQVALVALGFVIVFALLVRVDRRKRIAFEAQFPPITDEEFVARCAPGTNPEIALKVRRIISDTMGVEYERIYPSSRLVEDLDAD